MRKRKIAEPWYLEPKPVQHVEPRLVDNGNELKQNRVADGDSSSDDGQQMVKTKTDIVISASDMSEEEKSTSRLRETLSSSQVTFYSQFWSSLSMSHNNSDPL